MAIHVPSRRTRAYRPLDARRQPPGDFPEPPPEERTLLERRGPLDWRQEAGLRKLGRELERAADGSG